MSTDLAQIRLALSGNLESITYQSVHSRSFQLVLPDYTLQTPVHLWTFTALCKYCSCFCNSHMWHSYTFSRISLSAFIWKVHFWCASTHSESLG